MIFAAMYLVAGAILVVLFQGAVLPLCLSIGMVIAAIVIFAINKKKLIGLPLCALPVILVIGACDRIFQSAIFQEGQVNLIAAFLVGVCFVISIIAAVMAAMSFYKGAGIFEYIEY